MLSVPALLRVTLALAACAVTGVKSDSLGANPVSITSNIRKLNKLNPALGGPVARDTVAYVVPEVVVPLPREVLATAAPGNGSANAARRSLETSSTDIDRLNEHFGTQMETNVDTLKQWETAEFSPIPWPSSYWPTYGRYNDAARRDLGPGFFHIAIHNTMGKFKTGFIVDVTAGAEVWNQPVRGYQVVESTDLTRAQAASRFFGVSQYPFNINAKSLVYVKLRFSYMNEGGEDGPVIENGHADAYTATREYTYLLELNAQRQIIGGEWVGDSLTDHPDFLWFPVGRPDLSTVTGVGLSYRNVRELLDASIKCNGNGGGGGDTPTPTPPPTLTPPPPPSCAPTYGWCGSAAEGANEDPAPW
ncbi:hypothetical protein PybrP1_001465 [[Pythium] brassicae (nom. inval.)]|nr:hypothetical protein PybrP1_001465 [[Pythium] brassicae (nom. inval.)]